MKSFLKTSWLISAPVAKVIRKFKYSIKSLKNPANNAKHAKIIVIGRIKSAGFLNSKKFTKGAIHSKLKIFSGVTITPMNGTTEPRLSISTIEPKKLKNIIKRNCTLRFFRMCIIKSADD